MRLHYTTVKTKKNQSQYGLMPFTSEYNSADAVYIEHTGKEFAGNIFAAALPEPQSPEDVRLSNSKSLTWFDYETEIRKPQSEQYQDIALLNQIQYGLPFHTELAQQLHFAFMQGTINRYIEYDPKQNVLLHANGQDEISHCSSFGNDGGVNGNFLLTGTSGTGKSTAMMTALRYYPQVLYHRSEEIPFFTQVTYIICECPPNSNLSALYTSIAAGYDKALKNLDEFYQKECSKRKTLDAQEIFIRGLINKYHTLVIVVDEVQNMNFSKNTSGSFYTLLKLKNETKVSMAFCGLSSACDALLTDMAMKRRVRFEINATTYTRNKAFFAAFVTKLFSDYQWFYPRVDISSMEKAESEALINTLYDHTRGIIDQTISLYQTMNYEFVRMKSKPVIDSNFVTSVSNKYFPGILRLLEKIDNDYEMQEIRKQMSESAIQKLSNLEKENEEEKAAKQLIRKMSEKNEEDMRKKCSAVIQSVMNIYPNEDSHTLSEIFYKIAKSKEALHYVESDFAQLIIKEINNRDKIPSPKRKHRKKDSTPHGLEEFISNDNQPVATNTFDGYSSEKSQ